MLSPFLPPAAGSLSRAEQISATDGMHVSAEARYAQSHVCTSNRYPKSSICFSRSGA